MIFDEKKPDWTEFRDSRGQLGHYIAAKTLFFKINGHVNVLINSFLCILCPNVHDVQG